MYSCTLHVDGGALNSLQCYVLTSWWQYARPTLCLPLPVHYVRMCTTTETSNILLFTPQILTFLNGDFDDNLTLSTSLICVFYEEGTNRFLIWRPRRLGSKIRWTSLGGGGSRAHFHFKLACLQNLYSCFCPSGTDWQSKIWEKMDPMLSWWHQSQKNRIVTCPWPRQRGLSGDGSWTSWTPGWWWGRCPRPARASLAATGTGCARTTPAEQFSIFPWSSNSSPRHPRWSWAGETSCGPDTCPQRPGAGPSTSQLQCNGPWARVLAAWGGYVERSYYSPRSCTTPWSCPGGKRRQPWLWGRSRSCAGVRTQAATRGSGRAVLCCRPAAGPRTRRPPAPAWSRTTAAWTGSCPSRPCPSRPHRTRSARAASTRPPCCTPRPLLSCSVLGSSLRERKTVNVDEILLCKIHVCWSQSSKSPQFVRKLRIWTCVCALFQHQPRRLSGLPRRLEGEPNLVMETKLSATRQRAANRPDRRATVIGHRSPGLIPDPRTYR